MHSGTPKLNIVKKLFQLGLCMPTDCLTNISAVLGYTAIEKLESKNVVYPLNMCHRLFTAVAIDNIDVSRLSVTFSS